MFYIRFDEYELGFNSCNEKIKQLTSEINALKNDDK